MEDSVKNLIRPWEGKLHLDILEGAKNTFLFYFGALPPLDQRPLWVKYISHSLDPIAFDGVVFIDPQSQKEDGSFAWDFYNWDGSSAEMCGNAARCAVEFAIQKMGISAVSKIKFLTKIGWIEGARTEGILPEAEDAHVIQVCLPKAKVLARALCLEVDGRQVCGDFIDSGVPHFVIDEAPDFELARWVREHEYFGKAGTNVTFILKESESIPSAKSVTYERGVEGFTRACGTGAIAAAKSILGDSEGMAKIEMPGGILSVEFTPEEVYLTGEARHIGQLSL